MKTTPTKAVKVPLPLDIHSKLVALMTIVRLSTIVRLGIEPSVLAGVHRTRLWRESMDVIPLHQDLFLTYPTEYCTKEQTPMYLMQ